MMERFLAATQKIGRAMGFGVGMYEAGKGVALTARERCEYYEAYYHNNGLYDLLEQIARKEGAKVEALKALRNPVKSAVEFYPSTIWPGALPQALPIETENEKLIAPIEQLWEWSNWGQKKNLAARELAMTGSMFLRVATNNKEEVARRKVFLQAIKTRNVTDFELDHEGNVVMLRYDVKKSRWRDGKREEYYHTELWSKADGGFKIWEHGLGLNVELDRLDNPTQRGELVQGFVPWTYTPFLDLGELWGYPVHHGSLDKIDEVNRKATRLSQMMFRFSKPLWAASAGGADKDGRPLPSPKVDMSQVSQQDETVVELPGNSTLTSLVPDIKYDAYLKLIESDMQEIRRDLPEVRFYEEIESGNVSGKALFYRMTPAILKAEEIRGAAENSLRRAVAMALTIGQEADVWGDDLGSYEKGDFAFTFTKRDVLPVALEERVETTKTTVEMGVPLAQALQKYLGWNEEEAREAQNEQQGLALERASNEERIASQEGAVARTAEEMQGLMQEAVQAVADGAVDALIRSGAVERLAARQGSGENNGS